MIFSISLLWMANFNFLKTFSKDRIRHTVEYLPVVVFSIEGAGVRIVMEVHQFGIVMFHNFSD